MTSNNFEVRLLTPAGRAIDTTTHMVIAPAVDGYFGVLPRHSDMLTLLKPGLIEIHIDHDLVMKYVTSYGVASMLANKLDLMVEDAFPLDQIDLNDIKDTITQAQTLLASSSSNAFKKRLMNKLDFLNACIDIKNEQ